jgi:acyl transferase domain-containing protein
MEYEAVNRGGLRIAAKSELFNADCAQNKDAPVFLKLNDEKRYYEDGLFYVGQNVCLLTDRKELPELLEDVFSVTAKTASLGYELDPVCLQQESKIAIVGVGSFFPDSPSTAHFWHNIKEGTYSITEVPTDLWDPEFYYDPDRSVPNKTYSKIGAFVDESDFKPTTFGILPKVEKNLTRAQKFILMAAKEAIDRLGLDFWSVDRAKIGVFSGSCFTPELVTGSLIGIQTKKLTMLLKNLPGYPAGNEALLDEFLTAIRSDSRNVTEDTLPNTLNSFLSGRISHCFDFRGPNFTSDAACASSMAAIQNAIDALRGDRVDLAVVGAASSSTDFWSYVGFSKVGALSPDLSCPFDRRANGFVMGEGAGIVLLKRLEDAERDGDSILSVIAGIGSSSDGGAKGITAPNPEGQKLALKRAYRNAAVSPATIGFVEAHGTSTILGDQTEFNVLSEVYQRYVFGKNVIPIGSVKAQIGHLLSAAGIAGLIKAVLCISQKIKPKSINYENPNQNLQAENSPIFVNRDNGPWENDGSKPRRAAVSSMGFGGTNFHVVLEEYIAPNERMSYPVIIRLGGEKAEYIKDRLSYLATRTTLPAESDCQTVYQLLSDSDKAMLQPNGISFIIDTGEALGPQFAAVQERMTDKPSDDGGISWWDHEASVADPDKLCIMFPGQGAQFVGMGLELGEFFPEAREIFSRADRLTKRRWGVSLSTIIRGHALIGDADGMKLLSKTEYCQPAVLVVSVACYEIWRWLGIKPFCVIGHSLGEYSALVAAGVLEFEEALDAVMERGRLTAKYAAPGTMAAVIADIMVVRNSLKELDGVYLANLNSEQQQVISGSR